MADEDDIEIELEGGAETDPSEVQAEPAAEPKEISDDEGIAELKAAREAREAAKKDADDARAAQKAAEERYSKDFRSRESEILDGHISVLSSRRDALNQEAFSLKREFADAGRSGDYDKQADIQVKLAVLGAQWNEVIGGISNLEQRKKSPPKSSEPEPARKSEPQQPQLSQKSQDWVNSHRDVISNPRMYNKMVSGHHDALAEGLSVDSPEYFDYVEKFMGLKKDEPAASSPPRKVQAAAPPSKAPMSNGKPVKISLSKAELEWCKEINQKPEVYAREKAKLQREGRITN